MYQDQTTTVAPKLFISYRRQGAAMHAGRLFDAAVARFGEGSVFMDLEMAPGVDFVERITSAVGACRALLVVIGPQWAGGDGGGGASRLADPADFVRLEVETALRAADVTVIPVLVGGARMPEPTELPEPLRPLARRNAIELTDLRWRFDCERLMVALAELLRDRAIGPLPAPPPPSPVPLLPLWCEGVVLAVASGVLARLLVGLVDALNPPKGAAAGTAIPAMIGRRALVWAAVAGVLALWLSLRRGDQGQLVRRVAIGLLYGALAGALGGALYGVLPQLVDLSGPQTGRLAVASLAVTGGLLGMALGALWIPRRAAAGLLAGACGGALVQVLINTFGAPRLDAVAVAWQCLAIFGGTLGMLLALDVRATAAEPHPVVAAPEAARA